MFDDYKKHYCPYCSFVLDSNMSPKNCPACNGKVGYGENGTSKVFFDFPDLPFAVKDTIVAVLLIGALGYAIYLLLQ